MRRPARPLQPLTVALFAAALLAVPGVSPAAEPVAPSELLGHRVGADRRLAPWPRVVEYLEGLAAASDRLSWEIAGTSTLGEEMPVLVMTSPANQARLEEIRATAGRLAAADRVAEAEARRLAADGVAVLLVTCTIHSTEVGCTQMAMEYAWEFATTDDAERLAWMEDVVLLLMPSINPDGQKLVVDWYEEHLGTEYEGGPMPWLYQHYVGHDNNRDFYMLTQAETRTVNRLLYHRWFPQVFVDEHQMGSSGPRMFVPPQTDPLAPEVHSLIFRQADLIGTNMSFRLEEAGKRGVGHNMIFDSYWPGGTRNTAWWKNVTGLLTEVASARIATPIHVEPGELEGGGKGFPEYGRRANYPSPWEGGWWRLRDIVEYELVATWAALEACSERREEILFNFWRMGREAADAGRSGPPRGWVVPPEQHDPVAAAKLVELLLEHGVRVERAAGELAFGARTYPAGTVFVPAAQPYRQFLLTMLGPQRYPEVLADLTGPVIPPYDVTSWSLPISMGVEVVEVDAPLAEGVATETLESPLWPEPQVDGAEGGWLVPRSADTAVALVNRLLAAGHPVRELTAAGDGWSAGDLWLPAGGVEAAELAAWAGELHVPVAPLAAAPEAGYAELSPVEVGLYKPWVASMDEGWTRFLLERYELPYRNLANADIVSGEGLEEIDVLLLPDVDPAVITTGEPEDEWARYRAPLPPEYAGGLGDEGAQRLKEWVQGGGTAVALDSSGGYLIGILDLPVEDATAELTEDQLYAPGTHLRLLVDTSHPLGYGLQPEVGAYFAGSPAYRTWIPDARFQRRVVARYPDDDEDVLVSGYLVGAEHLARRAAVVEVEVGEGRVILIGFRAQHRAQPHATFKLLWNALLAAGRASPTG